MLNRRLLRIKVMQALYALRQAEASNQQLALDGISDLFQPDLNSMLPQNKPQLEGNRQLAALLFEEAIRAQQPHVEDDEAPAEVIKAANEAVGYYQSRSKKDRQQNAKTLIRQVNSIYDSYLRVLTLLVALGQAAMADRERRYRDVDEVPFPMASSLADNPIWQALANHQPLQDEALRHQVSWADEQAFVRKAYKDVLKADDTYRLYCEQRSHTPDQQQALMQYIVRSLVFKNDLIRNQLAEIDLSWAENSDVARGMAIRTVRSADSPEGLALEPLTDDWEADEEFIQTLFDQSLNQDADLEKILAEQLQHWEIERVAQLDQIILKMAVCELLHFPGIPIKVTINEYIEIAKVYSTPKSGKFVNGILDKLSDKLQASGRLRKSGRGLLDNK